MAKFFDQKTIVVIALVIGIAWYAGFIVIPGFTPPAGNIGGGGGGAVTGTQTVNKPIKFSVLDTFGSGAIDSDAGGLVVYDSSMAALESLNTDANGQATTSDSYPSGTILHVLFAHDSSRQWFTVNVPKMSAADADSLTTTPVKLSTYVYTAPTMTITTSAGTVIADAGNYNKTVSGSTAVLTATWFEGTDGRGYISSFDPVYGVQNDAVLVMKLSNTNYETVSVTGFDGQVDKGAATYWYKVLDDTTLTKWKIGNEYRYPGTGGYSFTVGLSGYSGDATDMDFYIYFNADPAYFITHGNWGPNALSVIAGAPYTVNLLD